MINLLDLRRRLEGKSLGEFYLFEDADSRMPWAYQFANKPFGRPYHDDHGIPCKRGSLLNKLQPWQWERRMDHTYLFPLPAKLISSSGPVKEVWFPRKADYPMSPGATVTSCSWKIREGELLPDPNGDIEAFLTFNPTLPAGQSGRFACWIEKSWVECYYTSTFNFFGRAKTFNYGMKFDLVDPMWTFPEWSFS